MILYMTEFSQFFDNFSFKIKFILSYFFSVIRISLVVSVNYLALI